MRMPHDEFESLERMEKELLFEEQDVSSRLNEKLQTLENEKARALTDKTFQDLAEEIANCDDLFARENKKLGSIGQVLEDQEKLVAQQNGLLQELERQETECLRWEKLHDLIGSADGRRFRVFAQGLTFDRLIAHANQHLRKMSDRYLLVRKETSSLDLDIIDGYQAGEIRSTKNLSGGESFIVSLALALGLSGMASRNVRIDSLFLDEGFGSLDSDTLEMALETLSTLQQEGKIIGIISHIEALKERIPTKITVIRKAGGRSRLIGPGCTSTSIQ
jgi:exonuclease SbcC